MKKLLFIAIAAYSMFSANAQIINAPKGPVSKIPQIPKSIIVTAPTVVANRTMGNYPDVTMRVVVWVEDAGEQGFDVKFQSSIPIETVEIQMLDPKQALNTLTLGGDKMSGHFYIDAPVYKGSNTYLLRFYAPGYPKGMWTAMIQRKASN